MSGVDIVDPRWDPAIDELMARALDVVRTLAQEMRVLYSEVVLTLPASDGKNLTPREVDVLRAELSRDLRQVGATEAKVVLLVNPAEVARTAGVSVLLPVEAGSLAVDRWSAAESETVTTAAVDPGEVGVLTGGQPAYSRLDVRLTEQEQGVI